MRALRHRRWSTPTGQALLAQHHRAAAAADLVAIFARVRGPKGIGALVARSGVTLEPLIEGGGQEGGLRWDLERRGRGGDGGCIASDDRMSTTSRSSGSPGCETVWSTACVPRSPTRSRTVIVRGRSPATPTSGSGASRPRRCWSPSTTWDSPRRLAHRVRRAPPSRRTCSQPWAYPGRRPRVDPPGLRADRDDVDIALDVIPTAVALLRRAGAAA